MTSDDGVHGFDFLHGEWSVANRSLVKRLAGCAVWQEFPGTAVCRPFFDGAANVDEFVFPTRSLSGMTLRLFDREREQWSIYWADSRTGRLAPPVVGSFASGRGDFYGDDVEAGQPVHVHFVWSQITPHSARWEQSFSPDGETWETNWIMELTRAR
jgi:hypothetical protein